MGAWLGLIAPAGIAPPIQEKLAAEVNAVLADPAVRDKLADLGARVRTTATPAEFGALMKANMSRGAGGPRLQRQSHGLNGRRQPCPPLPPQSPEEWDTRVQLAACYRLVSHFGMSDLIYNHITARIPGSGRSSADQSLRH